MRRNRFWNCCSKAVGPGCEFVPDPESGKGTATPSLACGNHCRQRIRAWSRFPRRNSSLVTTSHPGIGRRSLDRRRGWDSHLDGGGRCGSRRERATGWARDGRECRRLCRGGRCWPRAGFESGRSSRRRPGTGRRPPGPRTGAVPPRWGCAARS